MLPVYIILILLNIRECKSETCTAGQFVNSEGTCSLCPLGTFMSDTSHTYSSCIVCYPKEENVTVHYPCNATHNTGCPTSSFQRQANPLVCQLCRACDVYEARPCTPTSDAICCGFKDMSLVGKASDTVSCKVESSDGRYCCEFLSQATSTKIPIDTKSEKWQENASLSTDSMKTLTCSRNTYIHQATNSCKPCDTCSYIDQETHSQQSCDLCSSGKSKSRLEYCPKHCGSQNNGGLSDAERVLIALTLYLTGILLLAIAIFITLKVLSRYQSCMPPITPHYYSPKSGLVFS